jgi:competence protein ComEC
VAAVGLVVTAQVALLAGHPLRAAAERSAAATVRVVVSGDPTPVLTAASVGYGGRAAGTDVVAIPTELVSAQVEGRDWSGGGRLLLLAPRAGWGEVLPGVELGASGLLAPATRADLTVAVLRVRGPPTGMSAPSWWQRGAGALRDGLRRATAVLPEQSAELLPGLAVGDTSTMSWSLREDFRVTGLTHLVAVSGSNLVIIGAAVVGLLALLGAGPRARAVGALIALVGFVILVRPSPSVLRAAVMGGVGLLAVLLGRERSALPALAASVVGLLLVDPALGTDPGFALSVLATAALVLLAPVWTARLRRAGVPAGVAEALAVPTAAHVVTAPVVAGLAGQVSLVAVLANLAASAVVAPVTVLGVLAAVVSSVSEPAARLCVWLAGPGVAWLVMVAHRGATVPAAVLPWPSGLPGAFALFGVLLLGWMLLRRRRFRVLALAVLIGALLVLLPTRFITPGWPARGWAAVACDVGQGDAIVLETGRPGHAVLVDTGTETGAVDGCLSRLGITVLSLVVLTHMHADHIGGLAAALAGRVTTGVAVGPVHRPDWAFAQVAQIAAEHHVPVLGLFAGQSLSWPALRLRVLGPVAPSQDIDPDDGSQVNNTSLVIRAWTSAGTVLLCGDAELLSQAALLGSGVDLRADVLKMPHHGGRTTSPAFLSAVHPRLVLVSVGAGNPYGHPNAGELALLREAGALVRRTDESGDIAVVSGREGPASVARGSPLPAPRQSRHRAGKPP